MGRLIDLTDKRFGSLVVTGRAENNVLPSGLSEPMWYCDCDCGTETVVRGAFLRTGHTTSCGCAQKFEDLAGQRFGVIIAVERYGTKRMTEWLCRCDCGTEFVTRASSLKNGHTQSCGCRKKQLRIKDMVGKKFQRLTVLGQADDRITPEGNRVIRWHCECECGSRSVVSGVALRNGDVVSCGCYRLEQKADAPMSKAEVWVSEYLDDHGYTYTTQKCFPGLTGVGSRLLSYDFAVEFDDLTVLIECQGEQHYAVNEYFGGQKQFEMQQEHDRRKRGYAADNEALALIELVYVSRMKKGSLINDLSQKLESAVRLERTR